MWDEVAGAFACTLPVPRCAERAVAGRCRGGRRPLPLIGILAASVGGCGDGTGESSAAPATKVEHAVEEPIVGPTSVPDQDGVSVRLGKQRHGCVGRGR